jgi:CDP-glycerol glycerophosphotransferase (TagB/SpsB family)
MVNVWHGMPVKLLDSGSAVGRFQTDLSTATSSVHAQNLSRTWAIPMDRIPVLGLPRNDILLGENSGIPQGGREPEGPRRLVVWLPTYRRSILGQLREDGADAGNVFQLPEANLDTVSAMARSWDANVIVKAHPMAPLSTTTDLPQLSVWRDRDLADRGLTLYALLRRADVLVTDHSSVWIDFLLLDRPIVFAVADLAIYARTRGFYFSPIEDYLPGRVVSTLDGLRVAVSEELSEDSGRQARKDAAALHHVHSDAASASRLLAAIAENKSAGA